MVDPSIRNTAAVIGCVGGDPRISPLSWGIPIRWPMIVRDEMIMTAMANENESLLARIAESGSKFNTHRISVGSCNKIFRILAAQLIPDFSVRVGPGRS